MNYKNTRANEGTLGSNDTRNIAKFDKIDVLILVELLKNSDVKTSEISNKLKIPLSTIQRRRSRIDKSKMLKKGYEIDYKQFGLRKADILVDVSRGDCVDIAKKIVKEYAENVLKATIRIGDPKVNLVVEVIYNTSDEIFDIIHHIKRLEHVEDVRWSEIIKAVIKNDSQIMQKLMSKVVNN
jgi:DNA-binding Lrp family transcriptional regulator